MSWTPIASTGIHNNATTPAINTTGADLIVLVQSQGSGAIPLDNKSNTYVHIVQHSRAGLVLDFYYKEAPTVGSGHTFSNNNNGSLIALAFSGSTSTPLDQIGAGGNGSGTSIPAGSVTPSANNALVIAGWLIGDPNNTVASTVDNGFTMDQDLDVISGSTWGAAAAHLIQSVAASISCTLTRSNSGTSGADQGIMVSFLGSSGGGVVLNDANYRSLGRGLGFGMARGLR